jgi:hypothetical protein
MDINAAPALRLARRQEGFTITQLVQNAHLLPLAEAFRPEC